MIIITNGDLLEAKEQVIGHQINCKGIMNGGIAKKKTVFNTINDKSNFFRGLESNFVFLEIPYIII